MSKRKVKADETAVSKPEKTAVTEPVDLIGSAIEHMSLAVEMLRSKGGDKAESCAYVAEQLNRWIGQLEKLNE
jgi:hypothetical protein